MATPVTIRIQEADFDVAQEIAALTKGRTDIGAVVTFSGICRGTECGDAIAALFFAHYLRAGSAAEALSRAISSVFGVLRRTANAGSREIVLVEAQDEFVNPGQVFRPEKI